MKAYTKIVLLVALALFLTMTACTRQASTAPVASPSPSGEAPFPFTTPGTAGPGLENFATQTAVAGAPQAGAETSTPEIVVATAVGETGQPEPVDQTGQTEQGGGQAAPATNQASTESNSSINTPVVSRPETYTLQRGEWPICIARRYGVDIGALLNANGMSMNSKPGAGTSLRIPAGEWSTSFGSRSLKSHPASYSVAAGDTVYTIACQFGDVTPEAILAVNSLASADDLNAGMTIQIP